MQFSAKTKNEAITKACIELGVSSDQLDIQVVSEGSSGFFGIGSKPAIIKARKVDDNSEEKEIEKIVDSVKINAFKEDTVKETQKSAPKSVSRQNDVKPETKTETAKASKEEKLSICKEIIKKSLTEIHARCMVKKVRFDLETLLCDIFPSK